MKHPGHDVGSQAQMDGQNSIQNVQIAGEERRKVQLDKRICVQEMKGGREDWRKVQLDGKNSCQKLKRRKEQSFTLWYR